MKTQHDIDALIKRSSELSAELSRRCLTSEEVRWGTRIALVALAENDPLPSRRRRRGRIRGLAEFT